MADKNINTNTNNVNVKVDVKQPRAKRDNPKKSHKPNWLTRAIVIGIITLAVSVGAYYLKNSLDNKPKAGTMQTN
jgi:hypothetical protein